MKELNKRLIVSDFDGTLTTSQNEVDEDVRLAINNYVEAGGIFAVCTGRMLVSILPRVRALGLKGLVIAYQGSVIAEIESGKIIKNGSLNYFDVAEVCRFIEGLKRDCKHFKYGINAYYNEILYTDIPKDNERLMLYESITGIDAVKVDIPISEFITANKCDCQKIGILVSPDDREELYKKLLNEFGDRFDVTCSAKVLVEVSPLYDTKGEALKFIADYYGIPLSSTVAIGDNLNDLSMIETANVGVAVGNAAQGLKEAADAVTVTNNEGAVARIIEKYGYK